MRYAVITGSTKGIGRAIAEKLLRKGIFVIVNYANDNMGAKEFETANRAYKDLFTLVKQPLVSYNTVIDFYKKILNVTSKLDILVLNAATTNYTPYAEITKESWEEIINTNLSVPFFLIQKLNQHINPNTGRIIMIGSLLGEYPHGRSIPYGVSKAALHALSSYLVKEFADRRITVNTIAPGFVDTAWQLKKNAELRKRIEDKIALHRFAAPSEIADLCEAIIDNAYINGTVMRIDGGYCYQ